jgi:glycosyltransferase involved in cell wall biosynthesis
MATILERGASRTGEWRELLHGSLLEAITAALALRRGGLDDARLRRLAAATRHADPTSKLLVLHALARGTDGGTRRVLVDALLGSDAGRRAHAAWALGERPYDPRVAATLTGLAAGGGFVSMVARLTLERWQRPPRHSLPTVVPRRGRRGLRIAQVSLQGRLDAGLRGAGAGDGGGLATLLLSLTQALDAHAAVSEVVTFTRAFEDPSLPGVYSRSQEPIGQGSRIERLRFGPRDYLATAEQWAYREDIEAALARSVARHGPFDVAHLRFADVGTFVAARVFRRLGVPVVFTLAPDPHSVLRESEAAGRLDRETFPAADLEHHYVFRAWLVERMLREADALAVLPRPGAERELRALLGPSFDAVRPDRVWTVPEGIAVDTAARQPVAHDAPAIRSLSTAVGSLPERRLGLPLLLTVARLNRVKGIPQLVEAWAGDPELLEGFNLVVVGGDLDNPTPEERAVLAEIDAVCARLPGARQGLVLLGHRPHADVPQILRAAVHGIPGVAGAGGVYACSSRKEEFGLALLEALAAGLSVVGPDRGGPATYVEDGHSGFLADTTDLESLRKGLARAAAARLDPARAARARALVREGFTVDSMADRLVSLYAHVTGEAAAYAA